MSLSFCKLLPLLLISIATQAQNSPTTSVLSNIETVTVYKKNARVLRKAKANIPAGKSELILTKLSPKILINSIQVKLSNKNITLISAVPRANYLEETVVSERYLKVKDSIDLLDLQLKEWKIKENITESTKSTLMDNNPLNANTNVSYTVEDIKKLMEFRRKELEELEGILLDISYKVIAINKQRNRLSNQLSYLSRSRQKPTGEIVLQLQSASAVATNLEIEYVVTNAKWTPIYDLKSEGVGKSLELAYKAHISQSTGIDWKQVKVHLSSSDPTLSHDRPILNPMPLNLTTALQTRKKSKKNTYIQYQGSGDIVLEDQLIQKAPERNVSSIAATTAGVSTIDEGEARNTNGSRYSSNDVYIDGVRVVGNFGIPEDLGNFEGTNTTIDFDLELLQDIPSDGEQHIVEISKEELEVVYEYHLIPKIDKGAFLLAKISNYGKYNLLSGKANIFFNDVYLGQSFINTAVTTDTLLLSLGRDEKIAVRREKLKSVKKETGAFIKESIRFEISVRNNKNQPIEITLVDQIPISRNKDLEIKVLDSKGAVYNEVYGSLRWMKAIQPNETVKFYFEYEAKYPKDKAVYKVR